MRLEEYEAKFRLNYKPGDIDSMRSALQEYTRLINSKEAFEDDYLVAHFYHSCDKISLDYFKGHPELIKYLEECSYYYYSDSSDKQDLQSSTTGEALFFLCAVMHPELENDIKESCEAIVNYARDVNDSSEMWLTCEHPFGVEPIHIFATKYHKYGYLLGSFLVPNWDEEHMLEPLGVLQQWSHNIGINSDTLKAYYYCDNSHARENMLGYDTWDGGYPEGTLIESNFDVLSYLRSDKSSYNDFINGMAKRIIKMPVLEDGYYDDEESDDLTERVREMLYVHSPYEVWDDDFDLDKYLEQKFIDISAKDMLVKMKSDIELIINK